MVAGRGASNGPDLSAVAARTSRAELERWLDNPTSMMGIKSQPACPGWAFCPDFQWAIHDITLKSGEKLRGFARRRTDHVVALQTLDGKFRMLYAPQIAGIVQENSPTCRNFAATPPIAPIFWPIWGRWAESMRGPCSTRCPPSAKLKSMR